MMNYSFIIPVYNCKQYLPDCVESIRRVGVEAYEILLIDDGSTDGSGDLCDALARNWPEVRVIHQENGGASAARNRGIREAAGEKILFVDADDSLDAEALGKILADPRCDEADLTVFGLTFDYYYHGKCYRRDPLFYEQDGFLTAAEWGAAFTELFARNALSPLWNKVFKREILTEHQLLLNEKMFLYEDLEFVFRYMRHCGVIWNVPLAVYHYRQSEDEGNAGRRLRRIDSLPDFVATIEASLEALREANPAVEKAQTAAVLQMLYVTLAREKNAVSDINGIRRICRDFCRWAEGRELPVEASGFQRKLQDEKAVCLYLSHKKTALRHWLAVRVKAFLNH